MASRIIIMTFSKAMRVVGRVLVRVILSFILLFWSLNPLMQHAIDRTEAFWIVWALIEVILVLVWIRSFMVSSPRK
jgi:hypothetical protein